MLRSLRLPPLRCRLLLAIVRCAASTVLSLLNRSVHSCFAHSAYRRSAADCSSQSFVALPLPCCPYLIAPFTHASLTPLTAAPIARGLVALYSHYFCFFIVNVLVNFFDIFIYDFLQMFFFTLNFIF